MDDGPAASTAAPGLAGPQLDAACRTVVSLAMHAAIAGPAWWDANAPARRVTYAPRPSAALPPAPWQARRALDFCAELALALAPVHEAGAAHGALLPGAVEMRPDGGPIVRLPGGEAGPSDDLHGLGVVLLGLLTGRGGHAGIVVSGEDGPAADAAEVLGSLLADDPSARPGSARAVAAALAGIAAAVPDTSEPPEAPHGRRRRRLRLAAALALLAVAAGSGVYVAGQRVGPPGPALSPGTVSVPVTPPSP